MPEAKDHGSPKSHVVLVVEDEAGVRVPLVELLRDQGFLVYSAADAVAALEVIAGAKRPVELVVVDLNLPRSSGHRLIRTLLDQNPLLRIIAVSGQPPTGEGWALPDGVVYLEKPFHPEELLEAVRHLLYGAQAPWP
ncbi:MAG: response regulator [candidate division KSB1 bacterium]|nr:response regulator [candidate division KSB1 bacterium]